MIAAVEDAITARARLLCGNRVRDVATIPAEWDANLLERVLRALPGVFIAFVGGADKTPGGTTASFDAIFSVIAVTNHASGELARRRGDSRVIGAYDLIELLIPGLHKLKVPDVGTLIFQRVENLYTGALDKLGIAAYAALFAMPLSFDTPVDESTLAPFETFTQTFAKPPAGDPSPTLTTTLPQ
ncbi:phage protein Gp37 [Hydrocarboniphaga effusa]|uniref:phage protein Gp37 n=1 Tax=Hydrocarboniphaga effusa TaxID=243629 RepID=UPI003BABA109